MYAILDIETTGGSPKFEKITEIAIFIHNGERVVKEYSTLINPEKTIPDFITRLTGISNEMVAGAPKFYEVAKEIVQLTEGATIVAHNAHFDYAFIRHEFKSLGYNYHRGLLCTVRLSRKLIPGHSSYSLGTLCNALRITNDARHRAAGDAMAAVKLFDLLLSRDNGGVITKAIKNDPSLMRLPPNVAKEEIDKLPEETGVYYFYNDKGELIYIGKSNNIRKRVLSHFAAKDHPKAMTMKYHVSSITYELTGSELVALLLESDEIKKHKPKFNRSQRETMFQYGLFKAITDDGYLTLKILKIKGADDEPLLTLRNFEEGVEFVSSYCRRYHLCQKLCGLYEVSGSCFGHSVGQCKGACIGKELPEDYNRRVIQLVRKLRFENQSFFVIDEGRNGGEQSIVAVEKGRYIGFGYVDNEFTVANPEQLKFFIQNYADNRDVQQIIQRYLNKQTAAKVITY